MCTRASEGVGEIRSAIRNGTVFELKIILWKNKSKIFYPGNHNLQNATHMFYDIVSLLYRHIDNVSLTDSKIVLTNENETKTDSKQMAAEKAALKHQNDLLIQQNQQFLAQINQQTDQINLLIKQNLDISNKLDSLINGDSNTKATTSLGKHNPTINKSNNKRIGDEIINIASKQKKKWVTTFWHRMMEIMLIPWIWWKIISVMLQ